MISYRRESTGAHAGRLRDALVREFRGHVFLDVDSIEPGADFVERLREEIVRADVVLAVIGADWLTLTDDQGRQRLDNPDDVVRVELTTALAGSAVVIPVLVQDAAMPKHSQLPEALSPLARLNAIEISDKRWRSDVERLVATVRSIASRTRRPVPGRAAWIGAIALAGAATLAWAVLVRPDDPGTRAPSSGRTATAISASGGTFPLGRESTDPMVKVIEQLLLDRGFDQHGSADTTFNGDTEAAVKGFQQQAGLEPTGEVDRDTWSALTPRLTPGKKGLDVRALQRGLERLGTYTGKLDGNFSRATAEAVKDVQQRAGAVADGVVGPQTWGIIGGGEGPR